MDLRQYQREFMCRNRPDLSHEWIDDRAAWPVAKNRQRPGGARSQGVHGDGLHVGITPKQEIGVVT